MVQVQVQCTKSVQPPRFGRGTPILYEVFFHAFAVIPKFDNRFLLISHTFTVIKEMPRFCSKQRLDTLIVSIALERALIQVNFRVFPLISRLTWNRKKKRERMRKRSSRNIVDVVVWTVSTVLLYLLDLVGLLLILFPRRTTADSAYK